MFSRRHFLAVAGALGAAGLAPGLLRLIPVAGATPAGWSPEVTDLALARFTPHVGSDFMVRTAARHSERVTLLEATAREPHSADRPGLRGESFSLIFAGGGAKTFDDGSFTVTHPAMGAFPLFLVPVGQGSQTQRYQAVVDRRSPGR
jgi:hypothetical protein